MSLILLSVKSETPVQIVSREEAVADLVGTLMGNRVQLPVPMKKVSPQVKCHGLKMEQV